MKRVCETTRVRPTLPTRKRKEEKWTTLSKSALPPSFSQTARDPLRLPRDLVAFSGWPFPVVATPYNNEAIPAFIIFLPRRRIALVALHGAHIFLVPSRAPTPDSISLLVTLSTILASQLRRHRQPTHSPPKRDERSHYSFVLSSWSYFLPSNRYPL